MAEPYELFRSFLYLSAGLTALLIVAGCVLWLQKNRRYWRGHLASTLALLARFQAALVALVAVVLISREFPDTPALVLTRALLVAGILLGLTVPALLAVLVVRDRRKESNGNSEDAG